LQISDDGNGFDANQEYDGSGLSSIQKRAEDCGGRLEIDSTQGSGTRIIFVRQAKVVVMALNLPA